MRFLLDEMLPSVAAERLRRLGHDAVAVREVGLGNKPDDEILAVAVADAWVVVTENADDFIVLVTDRLMADRPTAPLVIVHRGRLAGGAIADRLARALDRWADANPEPWVGPHWISIAD